MRYCKTAVFFLAILVLASCTGSPDCFRADVFCAALVTDTLGMNDHGINQDAWLGLQAAADQGRVDHIAYIESVDTRDYAKNVTYFVQNGYDMIMTSGVGLQDETFEAAVLYPDPVFIGIAQPHEEALPNLVPVTFAEDQMGFLAGALAARLTETHVVGAVCETSGIPSMWRYCEGFRAGVEAAAEELEIEIKILVEYRDDGLQEKLFIDEAWGMERAHYLMKRGADVIFAAGGITGQGALRAASENGIHAIGTERDQAAALGESGSSVVTSIYGRADYEVQQVIGRLEDGNLHRSVQSQFGYVSLDSPPVSPESIWICIARRKIPPKLETGIGYPVVTSCRWICPNKYSLRKTVIFCSGLQYEKLGLILEKSQDMLINGMSKFLILQRRRKNEKAVLCYGAFDRRFDDPCRLCPRSHRCSGGHRRPRRH